MPATAYRHIETTPEGVPTISGTTIKVVEIAMDRLAHDWDADEIGRQHPGLSLSQIHSALAYYYDHQAELDAQIDRETASFAAARAQAAPTAGREKLRDLGHRP